MPSEQDNPIWVLCKIIIVSDDNNIEEAIQITKASNSQNPANTKDLRAVDTTHKRIFEWLERYYNIQYIFRRGQKKEHGKVAVNMKELSQAFTAFDIGRPDISFSNVAKIFSDSEDFYEKIFPEDEIQRLKQNGSEDQIKSFLTARLVPYFILKIIRSKVNEKIVDLEIDIKWKSMTYHIIWLYSKLLSEKQYDIMKLLANENYKSVIEETFEGIFESLYDFIISGEQNFPGVLKKDQFHTTELIKEAFLKKSAIIKVSKKFDQFKREGKL